MHRRHEQTGGWNLHLAWLAYQPEASLGQVDDQRIMDAFIAVILCELLAQAPDLDAHRGVVLRIIRGGLAQPLNGDNILLQLVGLTAGDFVCKVDQRRRSTSELRNSSLRTMRPTSSRRSSASTTLSSATITTGISLASAACQTFASARLTGRACDVTYTFFTQPIRPSLLTAGTVESARQHRLSLAPNALQNVSRLPFALLSGPRGPGRRRCCGLLLPALW